MTIRRIWAPTGKLGWGKDFQWVSIAEFHRSFTVQQALRYLDQIKWTLQKEARDLPGEGYFYTGLRHVFAEIDGLGKLYRGERSKGDTANNAIAFGVEYLGRVNKRYRDLFGLVFDMYRHGVAHTHLTKSITFRDTQGRWIVLGWAMTDEDQHRLRHLTLQRSAPRFFHLWLHVPKLVKDTLKGLNLYRSDLRIGGDKSKFLKRFKQGYIGTAAVFHEPPPQSSPTGRRRRGNQRSRLTLNRYSIPGISWVRKQISSGRV